MLRVGGVAVVVLAMSATVPAGAADASMMIIIKDHEFLPAELHVPAGTRIVLTVDNRDATPEEFESHELRVEKIVPGNATGTVRFGPLKPGTYPFFGDFNQATAQGKVVAE
jgi:plastocyanin